MKYKSYTEFSLKSLLLPLSPSGLFVPASICLFSSPKKLAYCYLYYETAELAQKIYAVTEKLRRWVSVQPSLWLQLSSLIAQMHSEMSNLESFDMSFSINLYIRVWCLSFCLKSVCKSVALSIAKLQEFKILPGSQNTWDFFLKSIRGETLPSSKFFIFAICFLSIPGRILVRFSS